MTPTSYILAIDQGTSGTKAIIFDSAGQQVCKAKVALRTIYEKGGKVEQEPEAIYKNVLEAVSNCLENFDQKGLNRGDLGSCGISNQRETFLLWRKDGKPLSNAIVWQCKRSVSVCERLKREGLEPMIREKTGLIIDPYFSGTKLMWLKENDSSVEQAIKTGEAFFGTIDTWLLYKLTNGRQFLTDYTNASRTLFFNLYDLEWDRDLIRKFGLTGINLPKVQSSSSFFGRSDFEGLFKEDLQITSMIGDSHAAAFGEQCFTPGSAKATLGTGCSVLMNIGKEPRKSESGMVTTICWSAGERIEYALEGVIVTCGATIEWLKNELELFSEIAETQEMAESIKDNNGVYLIPAFSGLGAPHWEMDRKASITGLSFDCNKNHIVRAALESIPYQIKDVVVAMESDSGLTLKELNIDGGISANNFVTGFLADLLSTPVKQMGISEVSGLGAAYLAGLHRKVFRDIEHLQTLQNKREIKPKQNKSIIDFYSGWKKALGRASETIPGNLQFLS